MKEIKNIHRALVVAAISIVLLAVWAFWVEPASFRIKEEKIVVSTWPPSCDGLKIAILADLHVGSPYNNLTNLQGIVEKVNIENPDLILLPGDFVIQGVVGGSFVSPESVGAVLSKLRAPLGVFAVLGNHDWWLDSKRVEQSLVQNNIKLLEDNSEAIIAKGCELRLVGVSDYLEGIHDIEKAMKNITANESVVAFTHNPDIFPELPPQTVLTIAGHTHGGQVYLPGIGRPIVPSKYGERYAIGHIIERGMHLYVSSGVGTSIIPVRFLVPPEVTILEVWHET